MSMVRSLIRPAILAVCRLKVSRDVTVNYAHVTDLHPDLLAQLGDVPTDEIGRDVEIVVAGDDIIGYVGPHPAMDFSVTDRSL
jgi:hypothetical protein